MSTLNVPWSVGSMCEGPEGAPNKAWSCTGSQRASWNWVVSASARCEDMEKSRRKYFADCAKLSGPALNETNETPQVHLQRSMTLYATMYSIFLRLFGLFLKQYCEVRGLGQGQNTVWSTEGHGQFIKKCCCNSNFRHGGMQCMILLRLWNHFCQLQPMDQRTIWSLCPVCGRGLCCLTHQFCRTPYTPPNTPYRNSVFLSAWAPKFGLSSRTNRLGQSGSWPEWRRAFWAWLVLNGPWLSWGTEPEAISQVDDAVSVYYIYNHIYTYIYIYLFIHII